MRKTAAVPVIALLLVTGCSAAGAEPRAQTPSASASATPPASAATEAAVKDTEEQTCLKLLGTAGEGPLQQMTSIVRIGDGTSSVDSSVADARVLHEEVLAIAKAANADIKPLLKELSSPTENVIMKADKPERPWTFNPDTWSGAVTELQARCAP